MDWDTSAEDRNQRAQTSHDSNPQATNCSAPPRESEPAENPEGVITIELVALQALHTSVRNTGGAPIQEILIHNHGAQELRELSLQLTCEEFARSSPIPVDRILPQRSLSLPANVLSKTLDYEWSLLNALTERAPRQLTVQLSDRSGESLAVLHHDWHLCPHDVWMGASTQPELLATFVTPNDPQLATIMAEVVRRLNAKGQDPSLEGYQKESPKRVTELVEASYEAIQAQALTYATPPASFEQDGQRVRLIKTILGEGRATCLDIALLAAAVLEHAGLHPIIVLTKGHASLGVWLTDDTFVDSVVVEPERIRNRFELNELLFFDPTCATSRPSPDFAASRKTAEVEVSKDETFVLAIDIARARRGNVRPLSTLKTDAQPGRAAISQTIGETDAAPRDLERNLHVQEAARAIQSSKEEQPKTRLNRWLHQLLDLTMLNALLNVRETRKSRICFLRHELGSLEEAIMSGKSLRVLESPDEFDEKKSNAYDDPLRVLLRKELKAGRLRCTLEKEAITERLKLMQRKARRDLDESGVSNLFLAAGFLKYRQASGARVMRRAPLVLFPLEIKRTGASRDYTISLSGEEPQANITLVEYLRREYDIDIQRIDPLPQDESASSIELVLRMVREKIKGEADWEVLEEVEIGEFSFSKYLLWKDLRDRTDVLSRSPLVKHLLECPQEPFLGKNDFTPETELDSKYPAQEILCPLSYDSSQLSAIVAAGEGATMVIQGPPGTGKSQTIANLIANSLGNGKSVLFVSEKMTALEVVFSRLKQLGLGSACLELHSKKANKKAVLAQFNETLQDSQVRPKSDGGMWTKTTRSINDQRAYLNSYVKAVHSTRELGHSLYTIVGSTIDGSSEEQDEQDLDFGIQDPTRINATTHCSWMDCIQALDARSLECSVSPDHPLLLLGLTEYSPLHEEKTERFLASFPETCQNFTSTAEDLSQKLLGPISINSLEGWQCLIECSRHLAQGTVFGESALPWLENKEQLGNWEIVIDKIDVLNEIQGQFSANYRVSPLELDLQEIESLRREMISGSWLVPWLRKRKIVARFKGIATNPSQMDIDQAIATLDAAQRYNKTQAEVEPLFASLNKHLGGGVESLPDSTQELRAAVSFAYRTLQLRDNLASACKLEAPRLNEQLSRVLCSPRQEEDLKRLATHLELQLSNLSQAKTHLIETTSPLEGSPLGWTLEEIRALSDLTQTWRKNWDSLLPWCAWQTARRATIDAGLPKAVEMLETGEVSPGNAQTAFDRAFSKLWLKHSISDDTALRSFRGSQHLETVDQLCDLDNKRLKLAQNELYRRIRKLRPDLARLRQASAEGTRPRTALGTLHREIVKKTKHKAIRKLLAELGNEATALKPCFLMSPISVAQHIDADFPLFDLVVFDEASQIPVWDAIGAIARGKQCIVVGDPKQLPPTRFFSRKASTDDTEELVEDLESILDECIGARVPCHKLLWHYRSRHESLIEFSNQRYYDGKLITFPANTASAKGVGFRFVEDGVYYPKPHNTNPNEAQALVQEVIRRLKAPDTYSPSIGIVTFNKAQADLIENLLDQAASEEPEVAKHLDSTNPEAIFVKNLESVQGDEREVVFFSIGYGRDEHGKFAMRFGPVGQSGGERRLNVAITRAKQELIVFSSIRYFEIDINRVKAQGTIDLRSFLQHAESAESHRQGPPPTASSGDDPLIHSLAERLREKGWQILEQVGNSAIRIDIAVLDPDHPDRYLACIEGDGLNYKSLPTARDRDVLRPQVLESLGWTRLHLWSTDWWRNPQAEVNRIHRELEQALNDRRAAKLSSEGSEPDFQKESDEPTD